MLYFHSTRGECINPSENLWENCGGYQKPALLGFWHTSSRSIHLKPSSYCAGEDSQASSKGTVIYTLQSLMPKHQCLRSYLGFAVLPEQHKSGSKTQKHGHSSQKLLPLNNTATGGQVTMLTHGRKAAKQEPSRAVCSAHNSQPPHSPREVPAKTGRGRGSIAERMRWDMRIPHGGGFAAGVPRVPPTHVMLALGELHPLLLCVHTQHPEPPVGSRGGTLTQHHSPRAKPSPPLPPGHLQPSAEPQALGEPQQLLQHNAPHPAAPTPPPPPGSTPRFQHQRRLSGQPSAKIGDSSHSCRGIAEAPMIPQTNAKLPTEI